MIDMISNATTSTAQLLPHHPRQRKKKLRAVPDICTHFKLP